MGQPWWLESNKRVSGIPGAIQKQPPWQFKLSMALSVVMLLLIAGYFYQSFLEIRKVQPVSVAIEKIQNKN
jgi:hypothetical protein